jgi:NitT/TauT family transport system permease protein
MNAIQQKSATRFDLVLYPIPAIVFLIVWYIYTLNNPQRQFIFSSPEQVISAFVRVVQSGELLRNSCVTVFEAIIGFVLGTTCGAMIGLSLWYSRVVAKVAQPYITALATVPIFALAPIIIVWFGIGILSKVALAFISTVTVAIV